MISTALSVDLCILTSLVSADVQGKGINMNVGASASVEKATIGGTGNSVSGTGDLKDCTISEGATANVQVPGSTVAGSNTYTPSIFVPSINVNPAPPVVVPTQAPTQAPTATPTPAGKPVTLKVEGENLVLTPMQPENVTVDGNRITIAEGQYKTAFYSIPGDIQDKITAIKVTASSNGQFCIKVLDDQENVLNDLSGYGGDMPNYGVTTMTEYTQTYTVDTKAVQIDFMSLGDFPLEIVVDSIEITYLGEETQEPTDTPTPEPSTTTTPAPNPNANLPANSYTFKDLVPTDKWLDETADSGSYFNVDANGVATIKCVGNYKSVFFKIPDAIDTSRLESVTFNGLTCEKMDAGAYFAVKVHTAEEYATDGKPGTTAYATSVTVPEGAEVKYISIMSSASNDFADYPFNITCNSVTFNLKEESSEPEVIDTFDFTSLVPTDKWLDETADSGSYYNVDANGVATIKCVGNYKSVFFKIPDTIDTARLVSVTFNGLTCEKMEAGAYFAVKVHTAEEYATDGKPGTTAYATSVTVPEGAEAKYISIMSSASNDFVDYPFNITCNSVTFNLE